LGCIRNCEMEYYISPGLLPNSETLRIHPNSNMSHSKDFPKILFVLEKADEYLGRGPDRQHCSNFLNAYLIDLGIEEAENEDETLYHLSAAESPLGKLTQEELLALASGEGDTCDDLVKKYPVLEKVVELIQVYQQLRMIESNQYASVLV